MALTVNIYYTGKGDNARRFAQEMLDTGVVDEIRARPGNLRYEYFLPLQESGAVLLIDSWDSQESLDLHHHSPVMQKIIALREKYDLHMTIERYITEPSGVPEHDKAFIRE